MDNKPNMFSATNIPEAKDDLVELNHYVSPPRHFNPPDISAERETIQAIKRWPLLAELVQFPISN